MITVTTDRSRKLVRAVMSGVLTVEDFERFSRQEQAAVRAMGLRSGEFLLLVETLDDQVQSQEVMNTIRRLLIDSPLKARRIATVRRGALSRIQSRRVSQVREGTAVFETVADAEAWLFADAEPVPIRLAETGRN